MKGMMFNLKLFLVCEAKNQNLWVAFVLPTATSLLPPVDPRIHQQLPATAYTAGADLCCGLLKQIMLLWWRIYRKIWHWENGFINQFLQKITVNRMWNKLDLHFFPDFQTSEEAEDEK